MAVAEASLQEAEASLKQAEAALKKEMRNLEYTAIQSPVDGVVVKRLVNIGQTVVSSMSASSLFYIATAVSYTHLLGDGLAIGFLGSRHRRCLYGLRLTMFHEQRAKPPN